MIEHPVTAMDRPAYRLVLAGILLLSTVALAAGWVLPVITIRTLVVFRDRISIIDGLWELLSSGDYLLVFLLGLFTVVVPIAKAVVALIVLKAWGRHSRTSDIALFWMERLGKWSMLDVFVVAVIIVIIKLSLLSDVTIHLGLYLFSAAVFGTMISVTLIRKAAARARD